MTTESRKLIIASHKLPYSKLLEDCNKSISLSDVSVKENYSSQDPNEIKHSYSNNSLVSVDLEHSLQPSLLEEAALSFLSTKSDCDVIFVGSPNIIDCPNYLDLNEQCINDIREKYLTDNNCHVVISKSAVQHNEYCREMLWPMMHYLLSDGVYQNQDIIWDGYQKYNEDYATLIKSIYQPGDILIVLDYQLMLLPQYMVQMYPDLACCFFLFTPFPSSEIIRCMPHCREILSGMLGAKVIGFQTPSYAFHFISSCTRTLGSECTQREILYMGASSIVGVFPSIIDVNRVIHEHRSISFPNKRVPIIDQFRDKIVILGIDRISQVKGVQHKLHTFDQLLSNYPELQKKVVLVQIVVPSDEMETSDMKCTEVVTSLNSKYGSLDFNPILFYCKTIEKNEYYSLFSIANVLLSCTERDSIDRTIYDYIVTSCDKGGIPIVSQFSGICSILNGITSINPWNYKESADTLYRIITMKDEERMKYGKNVYNAAMNSCGFKWTIEILHELTRVTSQKSSTKLSPLNVDLILNSYKKSIKRLFLLDYDGTLVYIKDSPQNAIPPPIIVETIKKLCNDDKNTVYIVSGRDQGFLEKHFGGITNIGLCAEHGSFVRHVKETEWISLVPETQNEWKDAIKSVIKYHSDRTPGSFIEEKKTSIGWHYRLSDPVFSSWQVKECKAHLENAVVPKLPVEIVSGKKILEVRLVSSNKGEIATLLFTNVQHCDFVFCIGDDKTDENMFAVFKHPEIDSNVKIFTCLVGSDDSETCASWCLPSPDNVINLIEQLVCSTD